MEKESESETVYLSMKQEDPNSLAVNLANFLNQLTHDGHELITYTNILRRILLDIFNHSFIDLGVKIVALKATVEFIKYVGCSAKDREKFQILLPYIMKMLTDALVDKKLEAAVQCELEILIDLAKNEPRFFRTQLVDVINTMFEIVECESYEKKTRHLALEHVFAYLDHDDADSWPKLYAALVALAAIAKACFEAIFNDMKRMVTMVVNCIGHAHLGVRVATFQAIQHLLAVLSPEIQEQCHDQLLPALTGAMDDANARVQDCVFLAFAVFSQYSKELHLTPYIDLILDKLRELLSNGSKHKGYTEIQVHSIQDSAISLLLTIYLYQVDFRIDLQSFKPYYKTAGARRLEMITLFLAHIQSNDVEQGMEVLTSFLKFEEEDADATRLQLKMFGLLCEFLGPLLLPYMSIIVPFFLLYAQLVPDKTILSADSDIFYSVDNSTQKKKREGAFLDMKVIACEALGNLADTQKEDFYPWISQTASILVPLFKFVFSISVREKAVNAMVCLLQSAKLSDEKGISQDGDELNFMQLSDILILNLLEVLNEEPETLICRVMLCGLRDCLQICRSLLNEGQVHKIMVGIKQVITESSNRKRKFTQSVKTEDCDAEFLREEKGQEDTIFRTTGQIVIILMETFKAAFLPFFDELSSYLITLWGKDETAQERCTILYIFCALVKECPEAVQRYCDVYLPILLDASNDEKPEARQNALYGLVLYATYGGSVFKPFVRDAISKINAVIMHVRAYEIENEGAYKNAVVALCSICQYHWEMIDSAQIAIWLNCPPRMLHENHLCCMVERLDEELFGSNYQHLPKILSVFAELLPDMQR